MTLDDFRNDFDRFHDANCLISERVIYFGSSTYCEDELGETGVDFSSSAVLIKNLLFLDNNTKSRKPNRIKLYFNSPGGDWSHGMAIYDVIRGLRSPVYFIGLGCVRSMGTIICQACDKRYLTEYTRFMVHAGTESFFGNTVDAQRNAEESKILTDQMYKIYLDKIKQVKPRFSLDQVREMCSHDTYMSAEKAKELNFIDEVLKYK